MFSTLIFITLRQWRCHKLRVALTLIGIALGVAVFLAARTSSISVRQSLKNTVEQIAGKATLQITGSESGFPEEMLEIVRATPGVKLAEPVIEVLVRSASPDAGSLLVVGVDASSDQKLREYQFDEAQSQVENPMNLITQPHSLLVSRVVAEKYKLRIGDKLPLQTPQGLKEFTVSGTFKPAGIGEVLGGQVAVMDVYSAQLVFNRGRNFDRIDLMTDPNIPVETVRQRLRAQLPSGLQVTPPSMREQSLDNWVGAMNLGQDVMSYLALAIGIFLIFNSFSIAVNQRWKEIGILRGLGVEARNIQIMFLGEALMLGVIGSALGIVFGFYLSAVASRVMISVASSAYGPISGSLSQVFRMDFALVSFALGIGASLLAAWLPARAAARIIPALSLHNIEVRQREATIGWRRITAGLILILAGLALIRFAVVRVGATFQFAYCAMILLGFVLLLPRLIAWLARALRPAMDWLFGAEGALAVDTLIRTPRRTSATVGAVMIGLSFVFSNGAAIRSQYDAIMRLIDRSTNADLLVAASTQLRSLTYRFDRGFGERVAALPAVNSVESKRFTFVSYRNESVALLATDTEPWFNGVGDILQQGDFNTARLRLLAGEGILISENFAKRFNVELGNVVHLDTPTRPLELPVVGIIEDYHSDKGAIFIERALYKTFWNDASVDYLSIKLKPGADIALARREIMNAAGYQQQAVIYTNEEYRKRMTGLIDQFFTLYHMQIVIAILVAAIGIINTLIISVSERRRELALIRAIGGLRKQAQKMIVLEALALIIIGIVTGAASSVFNTYFLVHTASMTIAGFSLPFRFPADLIILSFPVAVVVAIISAWWPARWATRLRVAETLACE